MLELNEKERELLERVVHYYIRLDWQIKQGRKRHAPPLENGSLVDLVKLYHEKLEKDK